MGKCNIKSLLRTQNVLELLLPVQHARHQVIFNSNIQKCKNGFRRNRASITRSERGQPQDPHENASVHIENTRHMLMLERRYDNEGVFEPLHESAKKRKSIVQCTTIIHLTKDDDSPLPFRSQEKPGSDGRKVGEDTPEMKKNEFIKEEHADPAEYLQLMSCPPGVNLCSGFLFDEKPESS